METRTVTSAGGVVFRRRDGVDEVALIAEKNLTVWKLPKGVVEAGETVEDAALREVQEETGLTGFVVGKIDTIDYWFIWRPDNARYHKFVHFFLVRCTGGDVSRHDWEVEEVRWFAIDDAIRTLTYKSEKVVAEKARAMIGKLADEQPS